MSQDKEKKIANIAKAMTEEEIDILLEYIPSEAMLKKLGDRLNRADIFRNSVKELADNLEKESKGK